MPKAKGHSNKAVGHFYNLHSIFRRLNGLYFRGAVKARVQWGVARGRKARRSREFGAYYYKERLIRIHPILDQTWVPLYVVEAVLHHEMCHQVCPSEVVKGRRMAHTKEFRQLEREYIRFYESECWMKENLKKLMRPAPVINIPFENKKIFKQLNLDFAA